LPKIAAPAIADRGGDDRELRPELVPEPAQRFGADDEARLPAMPAATPKSLRAVTGSWRVIKTVIRKVKIGAVELRMVASPASTLRSPQAIRVERHHAVEAGLEQETSAWSPHRGAGRCRARG